MTGSNGPSKALVLRLTDERLPFFERVKALQADPAALAELRDTLPVLESQVAPAGRDSIIAGLAPLLSIYGVSDRSPNEWASFWSLYADVLADVPLEALRAAVKEYVSGPDSQFFPKPGPLKALCDKHAAPARIAHRTATRALGERL